MHLARVDRFVGGSTPSTYKTYLRRDLRLVESTARSFDNYRETAPSLSAGKNMLIIAGHLTLSPAQRQAFVEAHQDLVAGARAYPGCLDLSISPDPFDPTRVNLMEVWRSEEDLAAWRKVANAPKTGVAFDDANVVKYEISHSGPPF